MRLKRRLSKVYKAIGREIRYVEYKLRRQQQEKKKKKQSRQDWLHGAQGGGGGMGHEKLGEVKTATEFNFNDEKGKFDTDRPANKQEEDLQLELALAMSRDDAQKDEQVVTAQPVAQTASLLDFNSAPPTTTAPAPPAPAAAQVQPPAATFNPWGEQQQQQQQPQSTPQWESFNPAPQPTPQVNAPPAPADPWGSPAPVQAAPAAVPTPSTGGGGGWEAFGDSFGAQPATPAVDPTPPQMQPQQAAPPQGDPFGALSATPVVSAAPPSQGIDLFGATDANGNGTAETPPPPTQPAKKSASDFLGGAGASLVNFDNLVSRSSNPAGMNPFGGGAGATKSNPFQKQTPGVPINQMARMSVNNGFDGPGMAPLQPMQSTQAQNSTATTPQSNNYVFGGTQNNLLFGAAPMSSGFNQQRKNPFS